MRFWKKILSGALATAFVGASFAQTAPAIPTKVVFSRAVGSGIVTDTVKETYPWGEQTLPAHRIAKPNAGFLHHTFGTEKPSGNSTQVLRFRFRSNGLFQSNPGSHFFVSGRSESTSWYNRGRGFIVGGLQGTANPCPGSISSQPETWWSIQSSQQAANYVWNGNLCGPAMSENTWYDVEMHVNSGDFFAYWIRQNGAILAEKVIQDTVNPESNIINNKLTGFAFGLVFADNPSQSWTLEFDNISVTWF